MKNSLCVALLAVINALFHLTLANSYSQSYRGRAGDGYPDSSGSYVTNFGNGNNKRNFVNMNESPDGLSISGASFSNDESSRPSVQKINVDFTNPNYRGGSQGPNAHWNPRATRTQVTNIGNGEGNRNLFVFHDNRHNEPYPRNKQDGNQDGYQPRNNQDGYQGETSYGHQGNTRVITNIGKGPDNDNRFYVNGKRVYPNSADAAGVHGRKAIEPFTSVISDVSQYANNFGNGHQNNNRIIVNGKDVLNPNAFDNNLNLPNNRQGQTGRRVYYYRMRNPHFKRILRKNVRDVVRNPLAHHNRRRGWRRTVRKLLHRRYY